MPGVESSSRDSLTGSAIKGNDLDCKTFAFLVIKKGKGLFCAKNPLVKEYE